MIKYCFRHGCLRGKGVISDSFCIPSLGATAMNYTILGHLNSWSLWIFCRLISWLKYMWYHCIMKCSVQSIFSIISLASSEFESLLQGCFRNVYRSTNFCYQILRYWRRLNYGSIVFHHLHNGKDSLILPTLYYRKASIWSWECWHSNCFIFCHIPKNVPSHQLFFIKLHFLHPMTVSLLSLLLIPRFDVVWCGVVELAVAMRFDQTSGICILL